jgi:serine/threonine-protein kinase
VGRDVAVMVLRSDHALDRQAKARFPREARALSVLRSPQTVTIFDFVEIEEDAARGVGEEVAGSLYPAMELLEGESLGERLKRAGRLPYEDAARFARDALTSLTEAHAKGVIHRDLKPDNLFLVRPRSGAPHESCKLLDFGIAKVLATSAAEIDGLETQARTVFGTPRYMSPEQAQGLPLDARSDLYSIGVLLYHMLVGRPPFADADAVTVMARHVKARPTPPAEAEHDVPAALSGLVVRALSTAPAERPPSADAFLDELDRALEATRRPPPAAPPPAPRRLRPPRSLARRRARDGWSGSWSRRPRPRPLCSRCGRRSPRTDRASARASRTDFAVRPLALRVTSRGKNG